MLRQKKGLVYFLKWPGYGINPSSLPPERPRGHIRGRGLSSKKKVEEKEEEESGPKNGRSFSV